MWWDSIAVLVRRDPWDSIVVVALGWDSMAVAEQFSLKNEAFWLIPHTGSLDRTLVEPCEAV